MAGTIEILSANEVPVGQIVGSLAETAYMIGAEFHLDLIHKRRVTTWIQKRYNGNCQSLLFHIIPNLQEQKTEYLSTIKENEYQLFSNFDKSMNMSLLAHTENYENDIALDFTISYISLNPNHFVTGEGFKSVISKEDIKAIESGDIGHLYLEDYKSNFPIEK